MTLDNLRGGINYDELKNKAQNREVWRNYMPKTCQLADNQWWVYNVENQAILLYK